MRCDVHARHASPAALRSINLSAHCETQPAIAAWLSLHQHPASPHLPILCRDMRRGEQRAVALALEPDHLHVDISWKGQLPGQPGLLSLLVCVRLLRAGCAQQLPHFFAIRLPAGPPLMPCYPAGCSHGAVLHFNALTAGRVEERYLINACGQLEVHSVMQARGGCQGAGALRVGRDGRRWGTRVPQTGLSAAP